MGAFDGLRGDQITHGCEWPELLALARVLMNLLSAFRCSRLIRNFTVSLHLPSTTWTDWGPHSGTIDWCETNYSHTRYIAEFVNTITNLPVIVLGLYGFWYSRQQGVPTRYALCYLGLSLIGIGSFGFHASLRWEWQLMDELPMVSHLASLILLFDPGPLTGRRSTW